MHALDHGYFIYAYMCVLDCDFDHGALFFQTPGYFTFNVGENIFFVVTREFM